MQDLNDLYYFSIVVEKGGFAAAGRALGIPKSRLSRRIAQLEERIGVRLLQRSTRRFAVTDAGQRFYRHCQNVVAEAQAAEDVVAQMTAEPRGVMRISSPIGLTQNILTGLLPEFCERYPQVRVLVISTDRRVDIINEGIDIALRVRERLDTDADLVVRQFGRGSMVLAASPDYLRARGRPQHPQDLAEHDTISYLETEQQVWDLHSRDGAQYRLEHRPRVICGDFPFVLAATLRGLGIALVPSFVCTGALANGELEMVLPEWGPPEGIVHCVFPSRRGMLPAVRALIDWLVAKMPFALESMTS